MSATLTKPSKTKKDTQNDTPSAMAFHAESGQDHLVGIGNLRVILCNDGGIWFAQGLEIDYAADGKSQKEVKRNFQNGLKATIGHHLQVYGNITGILKPAPAAIWQELGIIGKHMRFSQVTFHDGVDDLDLRDLPYSGIDYFERMDEVTA